jgi:hypothetical protein
MKIEEYIKIAESDKEIDGVFVVNTETLESKLTTQPEGFKKIVRWSFSDGTVVCFENQTDTEHGWKGHDRCWRFESAGEKVSDDSSSEVVSKAGWAGM